MKRLQIYLTERQSVVLKEKAKNIDISLAELIRRILDRYIDKGEDKDGG